MNKFNQVNKLTVEATTSAIDWALSHGMAFKNSANSVTHTAFSFTPASISRDRYNKLKSGVNLLGKLVHSVSEDHEFLQKAIEPISDGDAFFKALLSMHQQLHQAGNTAKRLPLLIMRSDFMDDAKLGPQLVEFNGIAAGMGPFGQLTHQLHQHLQQQWGLIYQQYIDEINGELVDNHAIEHLSQAIAYATSKVKNTFNDEGLPTFLMVVQEQEDNVFDQHLLEYALQNKGIRTVRKTFKELAGSLSTGTDNRLLLKGVGAIDTVYLRAGYQYCDYIANDLDTQYCCQSLMQTRVFIEKHHVAVNATVSQQLATSKRVQMLLSSMTAEAIASYGLTKAEAEQVKALLGEMKPVNKGSYKWLSNTSLDDWVLKNQGEGGGHCIFGGDILPKLAQLSPNQYHAWSLMRRLQPKPRLQSALIVRKGELQQVGNLISEIGMFTVHFDDISAGVTHINEEQTYAGYLIRSKPADAHEGGVHSGLGVLDSLVFSD